jgi:cell division septal protein FtsQ
MAAVGTGFSARQDETSTVITILDCRYVQNLFTEAAKSPAQAATGPSASHPVQHQHKADGPEPESRASSRRGTARFVFISALIALAGATMAAAAGSTDFAHQLGLDIEQVSVVGHVGDSDEAVFAALELQGGRGSLVRYDTRAAERRLRILPGVTHANVRRQYPGVLLVHLTMHRPSGPSH